MPGASARIVHFTPAARQRSARRWVTVPNLLFVLHVTLTAMVAWWAVILAAPWPTFPTSRAYAAFVAICADELYWATGFGATAVLGCMGCWAAWSRQRRFRAVRVASGILLGINHGMIAWLTAKGNPSSTGSGIYALIMLLAYVLALAEVSHDDG